MGEKVECEREQKEERRNDKEQKEIYEGALHCQSERRGEFIRGVGKESVA